MHVLFHPRAAGGRSRDKWKRCFPSIHWHVKPFRTEPQTTVKLAKSQLPVRAAGDDCRWCASKRGLSAGSKAPSVLFLVPETEHNALQVFERARSCQTTHAHRCQAHVGGPRRRPHKRRGTLQTRYRRSAVGGWRLAGPRQRPALVCPSVQMLDAVGCTIAIPQRYSWTCLDPGDSCAARGNTVVSEHAGSIHFATLVHGRAVRWHWHLDWPVDSPGGLRRHV